VVNPPLLLAFFGECDWGDGGEMKDGGRCFGMSVNLVMTPLWTWKRASERESRVSEIHGR
jgi:hypothetical protein